MDNCSISSDTDPYYHQASYPAVSVEDFTNQSLPNISSAVNESLLQTSEGASRRSTLSLTSQEQKGPPSVHKKLTVSVKSHLNRSDSSLSNASPEVLEGYASPFEARTLPNVLRRISNLIAMGSNVSSSEMENLVKYKT